MAVISAMEDEVHKLDSFDYSRGVPVDILVGFQFTGRFCGGLIADLRRKIPWFLSDFTDGLHPQTLSSIMYIYLATVTKAITFGGFLGEITDGLQVWMN